MSEKSKPDQAQTKKTQKRAMLIGGGLTFLFGVYLMVFLVPDVLATASGPERMTLARAGEIATEQSTYAVIEDAVWDCDTIVAIRGRSSSNRNTITTRFTEAFITDGSSDEVVMLAQMSGEMSCLDLRETTPTGYLTRMSADRQQELTNDARLARFFNATTFLEFCGYCGQENSLIGAIFGVVITLVGIGIFIFGLRMPAESRVE